MENLTGSTIPDSTWTLSPYPLSYRPDGVGSAAGLITRSVSEAKPFPDGSVGCLPYNERFADHDPFASPVNETPF
ncbi:MAG: hypothetical protein WCO26_19910 [Deltaproteobacteria bacterium]